MPSCRGKEVDGTGSTDAAHVPGCVSDGCGIGSSGSRHQVIVHSALGRGVSGRGAASREAFISEGDVGKIVFHLKQQYSLRGSIEAGGRATDALRAARRDRSVVSVRNWHKGAR